MQYKSIWLNDYQNRSCNSLKNDLDVDILIVGGGISGLSIAFSLKDTKYKIALVERNEIGKGVTARTTGKLTYLQDNIYTKLTNLYSQDVALKYLKSQIYAIDEFKKNVLKYNIDCDYNEVDSYLVADKKNDIKTINEEENILKNMNITVEKLKEGDLPFDFYYGLKVKNTAVFHPLKYLLALKKICLEKNVLIYEHSNLTKIIKKDGQYISYINNKKITSKYIIFATHYPYFLKPFFMPLKCQLKKSIIKVYKSDDFKNYSAITVGQPMQSLRYYQQDDNKYCLYINNSYNLASSKIKNNENLKNNFQEPLVYEWSNKDIITDDGIPFIGSISKDNNTMLIATGYNSWGMTNGILSGQLIRDIILNQQNELQVIFDPLRKIKLKNLSKNLWNNIVSYVDSKNRKNNNPKVKYFEKNGISLASYTDENNCKHTIINKCPHLKCGLKFNEKEKTWDCHCHGSRFDIDGNVIEGPSNYSIKYEKD